MIQKNQISFGFSFPREFCRLYNEFRNDPHRSYFLEIEGISDVNMDLPVQSKEYFSRSVSDVSIDANANANGESNKNPSSYLSELTKSFLKLEGYYLIWRQMEKDHGVERANEALTMLWEGDLYFHDASGAMIQTYYCYAYSTSRLMLEGRTWGHLKSTPPKRASSFLSQVIETTMDFSNQQAGAVAIADLFVNLSWYTKREDLSDKDIENLLQNFVHILNNTFRISNQAVFSNVSIFDRNNFNTMFEHHVFPDGTKPEYGELDRIQRVFLDFFSKGDPLQNGAPYRFPVVTVNFLNDPKNGHYMDESYLDMVSEKLYNNGCANLYTSSDAGKVSSCCFTGDTDILVKDSVNGVRLLTFEEFDKISMVEKHNWKVHSCGFWKNATKVVVPLGEKSMYEITTSNDKKIVVTEDHIHPTFRGDVVTADLSEDDYLEFCNRETAHIPEKETGMSYNQGVLIGAYLGNGSRWVQKIEEKDRESYRTTFSLNKEKVDKLEKHLRIALDEMGIDSPLNIKQQKNNNICCDVCGEKLYKVLKEWVHGDLCYEKRLNLNCLVESVEFRKGILDGYYITDGGNSNRIYTTSKGLVKDIEALCTSLGIVTIINESDRRDEPVVIRGEEFNGNHVLYCIRTYCKSHKSKMADVFKTKNNSVFFKIKSIRKLEEGEYNNKNVYCFEIKDKETPYFTLPNGIVTHNCRLVNDFKLLKGGDSFGNGGLNIGSARVVTINYAGLALKAIVQTESGSPVDRFFELLEETLEFTKDLLVAHRKILHKRAKDGFIPFVKNGYIDIDKHLFSTFGINGFYEACAFLTGELIEESEEAQDLAFEMIRITKNYSLECCDKYGVGFNVEQVPAESLAVKNAEKDMHRFEEAVDVIIPPLYSNQFVPLWSDIDVFQRAEIDGKFSRELTGGGITHINMDSPFTNPEDFKRAYKTIVGKGVEHFAFNLNFNRCEEGHFVAGGNDVAVCEQCGAPVVDSFTRVIGYFTPVTSWNRTRREYEFAIRRFQNDFEGDK